IETRTRVGKIHADLSAGADVAGATRLRANRGLSGQGIKLVGDGFYLDDGVRIPGHNPVTGMPVERTIIGPKDVLNGTGGRRVVDFFGLSEAEAKSVSPHGYQQ